MASRFTAPAVAPVTANNPYRKGFPSLITRAGTLADASTYTLIVPGDTGDTRYPQPVSASGIIVINPSDHNTIVFKPYMSDAAGGSGKSASYRVWALSRAEAAAQNFDWVGRYIGTFTATGASANVPVTSNTLPNTQRLGVTAHANTFFAANITVAADVSYNLSAKVYGNDTTGGAEVSFDSYPGADLYIVQVDANNCAGGVGLFYKEV
jgi:hypothetical protein